MLQLAFTISSDLKQTLTDIDNLRARILLTPFPPKHELHLQWEAQVTRIYYSFLLSKHDITKQEVTRIITSVARKQTTEVQRAVFNHKRTMDYISLEWQASRKPVTSKSILDLAEILFSGFRVSHAISTYRVMDTPVKNLLDYLQAAHDHPVIQAGVVYSQFILLSPFGDRSEWIARILAYLFLYKSGYEARRLLVLERYWHMTSPEYQQAFASLKKENNSTTWLGYFAGGIHNQFELILTDMAKDILKDDPHSTLFYLTTRQKTILTLLSHPDERITNKQVQKFCKVSQITASRDLSHLASLSLIFSHGKGRSVYYTKA